MNTHRISDISKHESNDPFIAGRVVDDKYEIVELLGKGGMGAVYRATQLLLNVDVALKTLDRQRLNDNTSVRRFQTEARAAFSLKHTNLVNVHDFGVFEDAHPFLVMELVNGTTLQEYMNQRPPLPLAEIESIFVQLCFGLAYAHQNYVVHRDVKPGNIMLVDGLPLKSEGSVKILDFGIAKILNSFNVDIDSLTKTGEVFGSPLYMSPEQCSGSEIDPRSDVYSLGCVLFEALTGTPPLVGSNSLRTMMLHQTANAPSLKEAALGREYPQDIERIVAKMLAKDPADRYQNLGVVALELSQACSGQDTPVDSIAMQSSSIRFAGTTFGEVRLSWLQLALSLVTIVSLSVAVGFCCAKRAALSSYAVVESIGVTRVNSSNVSSSPLAAYGSSLRQEEFLINQKTREAFEKCQKITAVNVMRDGVPKRRINFPAKTMGSVTYRFQGEGSQQFEQDAVGTAYLPASAPLTYHLSDREHPEVLSNSFVFDKVDKNIFAGLSFGGSIKGQSIRALDDETSGRLKEDTGTARLISAVCTWKNLSELSLSNTVLTDKMLSAISKVRTLKRLTIRSCDVNPQALFTKQILSGLERIDVNELPLDCMLEALTGSKNLKVLNIGESCSFSARALNGLVRCPRLNALIFTIDKVDAPTLKAVLKLKSLQMFSVRKDSLNSSQRGEIFANNWRCLDARILNPNDVHVTFIRAM